MATPDNNRGLRWGGLVLAGGASRRMGQDKAALQLDGETLLARAERLLAAEVGPVWVAGQLQHRRGLPDSDACRGPLAGIAGALAALRGQIDALVVMPVDMPLLPAAAVSLVRQHADQQRRCIAFADSHFPLALLLDARLDDALHRVLTTPGSRVSVHALLAAVDAGLLPVPPAWQSLFLNCNVPQEWQAMLARHGTGSP